MMKYLKQDRDLRKKRNATSSYSTYENGKTMEKLIHYDPPAKLTT